MEYDTDGWCFPGLVVIFLFDSSRTWINCFDPGGHEEERSHGRRPEDAAGAAVTAKKPPQKND